MAYIVMALRTEVLLAWATCKWVEKGLGPRRKGLAEMAQWTAMVVAAGGLVCGLRSQSTRRHTALCARVLTDS